MSAREALKSHQRVVVKVGTTTLTYPNGRLNLRRIEEICTVLSDLCNQGKEMILVTSGAIAVGADRLGLTERPRDVVGKQAASAVGQAMLMQIYQRFFSRYNQEIAQILLTKDVIENEVSKQNARNTLKALREMRVIPLVNENDSVSTDELGFSENDTLSAYVSILSDSELLINLSDTDGMYDADPKQNPGAKVFREIPAITREIEELAGGSSSKLGSGGMISKITAAKLVTERGIDMVIASGEDPAIIWRLLAGEPEGTLFIKKSGGNVWIPSN
ncbi:MAG: glutamate 5-kinase [Clostridiales bacterium]|jgi:glutamate 5-kinase|nr:glutamate 5-kinase [Clostridiales bacterium]